MGLNRKEITGVLSAKGLMILLAIVFFTPGRVDASTATITISSGDTIFYNTTQTEAVSMNVSISSDTNVMGLQFDIQWDPNDWTLDSSVLSHSSNASGFFLSSFNSSTDTWFFNVSTDSISLGTTTISAVRLIETAGNKGLSSGLYELLTNLKWLKLNQSDSTVNSNQIIVTNFIFRDAFNQDVTASSAKVPFLLFVRLVLQSADFNGDNVSNFNDLLDFLRVFNGLDSANGKDYGTSVADRTFDGDIDFQDLLIFLRFFNGLE